MRVAVLGAGPSGLALCHYLRQTLGASLELTLVEASDRVGGWLRSERRDGFLFERGPHSFRPSTPAGKVVLELVDDLGLRDEAITPAKGSGRRFLFLDGRIQEVAPSLRTPLGRTLLLGALRDLCTASRAPGAALDAAGFRRFEAQLAAATTPGERAAIRGVLDASDESVAGFVGRRFGTDLAEQAADAMVAGIFAGDARRLSARACFPLLPEFERDYGGVVWAMLRRSVLSGASKSPPPSGAREEWIAALGATGQVSFRDGMETLARGLAASFEAGGAQSRLLTGHRAVGLADAPRGDGALDLTVASEADGATEVIEADYVFSALPSAALEPLLPSIPATRAVRGALRDAPTVDVAVVNLGYDDGALLPHEGVGHLIPSREWETALGVIWASSVFPQQAAEGGRGGAGGAGETRLTVMMGGQHAHQAEVLALESEAALVEHARSIVERHLGVTRPPTASIGGIHRNCIPQYTVGHSARVEELAGVLAEHRPRLRAIGNSLYGVGIADSIAVAQRTAEAFARELELATPDSMQ